MSSGPLILVVEDERQMMRFLRTSLTTHGYRIAEATSATEALAQATTRNPDVVLLDLGLPDMDGIEVARQLRGWSKTPIWSSPRVTRKTTRSKRWTPELTIT